MNNSPWDRFILLGAAVVVTGLSVLFVMKARGFGETFRMNVSSPNNDLPEPDIVTAEIARNFVVTSNKWETPIKGVAPKPVPLFVSIPIVESQGKLIDMLDPSAPMLREPVTNAWLLDNGLDFLNSAVLQQDPDGDGFSSLAEWDAKTDPTDPNTHPPYADKLVMHSRQQQEYKLRFAARPDPERFQIMRLSSAKWPQRDNFYLKVGETSEDGQFRLDSVQEKRAMNDVGIEADATELTITYLPKNEEHVIVRNQEYGVPTYFAELEFLLAPGNKFYVKEGDTFPLVKDPETKYRVTQVNEESVIVTYQTGAEPEQTVEIRKK
jgi:hypothetical protein